MDMLKTYNEYVNYQLNEGLFDFIRKLFTGAFKAVSDRIKKNVQEFSNIVKTKDSPKDAFPELKKKLEDIKTDFKDFTKESTSLLEYKSKVKNYFVEVYMILDTFSRRFNAAKFKPFNFYQGSKNPLFKKIFQYENPENFMKNLDAHITSLLKEKGEAAGLSEIQLAKFEGELKESIMILEQEENAQIDQIPDDFKDEITTFISTDLIDPLVKKLQNDIKESGGEEAGKVQVQKIAKSISDKISNNLDSKKKIIRSITQIDDKDKLLKIRDILGLSKEDTPL